MRWCTNLMLALVLLAVVAGSGFAQLTNLPTVYGFEGTQPAYWNPGTTTGATFTWATDQSHSMGHSLKIDKPGVTADTAAWISDNMCDIWSPINNKNVDIFLGAYVRTQGVNTNPATNDARWYIAYDFWDSAGAFIGETKLPIPQTSASSGQWLADTNGIGATILPKDAWKTIVKFVGGEERDRHGVGGRFHVVRPWRLGGTGLEHEPRRAVGVVLLAAAERRKRRAA